MNSYSCSEIICYVCDKYFPLNQLQNHVNKCKVIFETQNKVHLKVPEEYPILYEAIKSGILPDADEIENFNRMIEEQGVKYGQSIATEKEFKEMNKNFMETIKKSKSPPKVKRNPGERPRMLFCPLCGREFGSMSLPIHLKSCKEKFNREQEQLPKNMRKDADKILNSYNQNSAKLQSSGNYNMDQMNNDAFETYKQEALVRCDNCGRTFLPDRLIVHQRSCLKHKVEKKK